MRTVLSTIIWSPSRALHGLSVIIPSCDVSRRFPHFLTLKGTLVTLIDPELPAQITQSPKKKKKGNQKLIFRPLSLLYPPSVEE